MPSKKAESKKGKCDVCGIEPRKLASIESGQWLCLKCRQKLRRASKEYYATGKTITDLRQLGFLVADNISKAEAKRLKKLYHLECEGGYAPEGASIEEIERRLGIQIARRRGLLVSDDISLSKVRMLTAQCLIRHYHTKVVGVTFENEDGSDRQEIIAQCTLLEKLRLEYDENHRKHPKAIRVHRENGDQLGYLNSELAEEILQKAKMGYAFLVQIKNLTGGIEDAENLGVNLIIVEAEPGASESEIQAYVERIDLSDVSQSW